MLLLLFDVVLYAYFQRIPANRLFKALFIEMRISHVARIFWLTISKCPSSIDITTYPRGDMFQRMGIDGDGVGLSDCTFTKKPVVERLGR